MSKSKTICAVVLSVLLAACGSGGGGGGSSSSSSTPASSPVASTASFPIESTVVSLVTTSSAYTVYATDTQGNGYTLTVSYSPGTSTYYQYISSAALPTFTQTGLLKVNGVTSGTSSAQVFYSTGPFLVWGGTDGSSTTGATTFEYMRTSAQAPLPATAKVVATGSIYSGTQYRTFCFNTADCSVSANYRTITLGTQSATWSLEADTETTAWLCVNITTIDQTVLDTQTTVEADCFRINQAGAISAFKTDITTSSTALGSTPTTLKFR